MENVYAKIHSRSSGTERCFEIFERRTAMFVNKMKTFKAAFSLYSSIALIVGTTLPFYASAINPQYEKSNIYKDAIVCYDPSPFLRLVEAHPISDKENIQKPNFVQLNDKGVISNYFVGEIDCRTFLLDVGVEISDKDVVKHPSGSILEDKTVINVERVEYKLETRTEKTPYGTMATGIDTIPKGTKEVISEGVEGVSEITYLVKYVNGKAEEEAVYTEKVITEPVDEIANVGIGGSVTAKDGTVYHYSYRKQMEATAYTYLPPYTSMTTATGATLRKGIVAVDPKVIPMHTKMFITGSVEYGLGVAEDTGGAIKGNIIDLAFMSYNECIQFGRRQMQVYILE